MAFKITNRLIINNDNLKFNGNFKSHIIIRMILKVLRNSPTLHVDKTLGMFIKNEHPSLVRDRKSVV